MPCKFVLTCANGQPISTGMSKPKSPRVTSLRAEAARLVRAAFNAGETVEAIADRCGVSRRSIYGWVAGTRRPSRTVSARIVKAHGAKVAS